MSATVRIPTQLRNLAGGSSEVASVRWNAFDVSALMSGSPYVCTGSTTAGDPNVTRPGVERAAP